MISAADDAKPQSPIGDDDLRGPAWSKGAREMTADGLSSSRFRSPTPINLWKMTSSRPRNLFRFSMG